MMSDAYIRLTAREKARHDRWDTDGKRGVWPHQVGDSTTFNTANPTRTLSYRAERRARLHRVTWAGDVYALRVLIRRSDGELLMRGSAHIPSVSGQTNLDNRSTGFLYPGAPSVPTWPSGAAYALQTRPAWDFVIEPNWVLEKGSVLYLDYSLNNPADGYIGGGGTWSVNQLLWLYEFPDWRPSYTGGGAR